MSRRRLAAMALIAALTAGQGLAGPAEMPPEGFAGDRYVDSRGCAFQRAEIAGRTVWAAVLDAARAQLCGLEATEPAPAAMAAATAEPEAGAAAPAQPAIARDGPEQHAAPVATGGPDKDAPRSVPAREPVGAFVQIGAYGSRARAVAVMELAQEAGFPARVRAAQGVSAGLSLVRLGPFRDDRELRYALAWARAAGFPDAYRVP